MRGDVQVNLRLPVETVDALKAAAKRNGCSLTAQVTSCLRSKLATAGEHVKTQVRIPRNLHAALVDNAKVNGRSFNSEIVERLSGSLSRSAS